MSVTADDDKSSFIRSELLNQVKLHDHLTTIVEAEEDLTIFSANIIFQRLAERLSIVPEDIKKDDEVKRFVKENARQVIEKAAEQREAAQATSAPKQESQPTAKKRRSSSKEKAPPKKKRKSSVPDKAVSEYQKSPKRQRKKEVSQEKSKPGDSEKHKLGRLIRTLKFPPSIYKDLSKDDPQEYVRVLRERLIKMALEKKVVPSSRLPTLAEAQHWIKEKEYNDELSEIGLRAVGLDDGLPEGAKRKRSTKSWASEFERVAKATSADGEDSDESSEGDEDDEDSSETMEVTESPTSAMTPVTNAEPRLTSVKRSDEGSKRQINTSVNGASRRARRTVIEDSEGSEGEDSSSSVSNSSSSS